MKVGDLIQVDHPFYGRLQGIVKRLDFDEYGSVLMVPFNHPRSMSVCCHPSDVEVLSANR